MSSGVYIIGNRNKVTPDATGVVLVNCHDMEIDSTYNDQTILASGNLIVDAYGLSKAVIKRRSATISGTGNTISFNDGNTLFFLDASDGDVSLTLAHSTVDRVFVRIDETANTATITPASGLINGAGSYNVATQYEKITIVSDGTDLYF